MEFQGLGLANLNYGGLLGDLSPEELKDVWALFGLGSFLAKDYDDRKCTGGGGTCSKSLTDICTSNCYFSDDFFDQLFERPLIAFLKTSLGI